MDDKPATSQPINWSQYLTTRNIIIAIVIIAIIAVFYYQSKKTPAPATTTPVAAKADELPADQLLDKLEESGAILPEASK